MTTDQAARLQAGRAFAREYPRRRKSLLAHGYRSGEPIIMALDSDTIASVFERATQQPPPVVIGVYGSASDQIRFIALAPDTSPARDHDDEQVGAQATIGMLADYLGRQNSVVKFRVPDFHGVAIDRLALLPA